jgi:hypothetical protein
MSQADRSADSVQPAFHPVSHYGSPADVVNDPGLSTEEKRLILSSWASDMYVVESQPALREIPGIPHRLRLDDILSALKQLDADDDPPPRGGLATRLPRLDEFDSIPDQPLRLDGQIAARQHRPIRVFASPRRRWTRDENIRRYRKLLNTQLTGLERSFIERRLAEELRG